MKFLILAALILSAGSASAQVVERIVAIVNDDVVLQSDLSEFQNKLKKNGLVDDAILEFYDRKRLASDNKLLVNYLIDERLMDSEIRKQGIQAPIERVEGEIRNLLSARGLTRDQMKAALKARGIQFSEYQDFIKAGIQRQSLLEREVSSKIKISDDDIATYYVQKNLSTKPLVFEMTLAQIVFLDSNGGPEKSKERAEAARARLQSGSNFEAMAAQYSEDPQFTQGALFGTFRMGDLIPAIEKSVQHLSQGDTSSIVKMPDGYRIFRVIKKTLVPSPDLERRKGEIGSILFRDAFQRQYSSWIDQLKKDSYIRINTP
jgi:peptidyl-prolyl cis-trans isomerase SurA